MRILIIPLLLALTGCAGTISPPWQERVVIRNDPGGFINRFAKKYKRWDRQNKLVVVDGYCGSSCTMAIGMIKRQNLCVTQKAVFGFHGAWVMSVFGKQELRSQTHLMTEQYTDDVRAWIDAKGGLSTYKKMLYMKYPETMRFFRMC